jgi:hypothetical protein
LTRSERILIGVAAIVTGLALWALANMVTDVALRGTGGSEMESSSAAPTPRWTPLMYHPEQQRLWDSRARFRVTTAGRRSGKTELCKRRIALRAMTEHDVDGARFFATAPTLAQAKEIFWRDLQALVPERFVRKTMHTELSIELVNGARIMVAGLDRPQRIEGGTALKYIVVDEIANCPQRAWEEHIRPCLSERGCEGDADLIGVPEGKNFLYDLHLDGLARKNDGEWDAFTWKSADILAPEEIAAVKGGMDARTYRQEYEGSFESFEGRAYYAFGTENHRELEYDPALDLVFCFDFNVSPGVAAVVQEQELEGVPGKSTCVIGEAWVDKHSNTPMICKLLARDWAKRHKGVVVCRGDSSGGARSTSQVRGSDWDIIREHMRKAFPGTIEVAGRERRRASIDVPRKNPPVRSRLNAVNARISDADDARRLFVDPRKAPHVVRDLDSVEADAVGDIVKEKNSPLTHISDALGYHVWRKHPTSGAEVSIKQIG